MGFYLEDDDARMLLELRRRYRAGEWPPRSPTTVRPESRQNVQFVHVTGGATEQDGVSYYPARLWVFYGEPGVWQDATEEDALWLTDAAEIGLEDGGIYQARQVRESQVVTVDDEDVPGPLFATVPPGDGGGVRHVRIEGAPQWGTGGSACEFFPGFVRDFNPSDCTHSDGAAVYLKQAVGAPLGNDGNSVYTGLFRGTFTPCGGTAGRPVYETTERIVVVDVECATGAILVTYNGRYTPFIHSQDHTDCRNSQFSIVNGVFQI